MVPQGPLFQKWRERERDRDRETDRQRDRETETDRDRDRQRQRQTDRDRQTDTQRHRDTETDRETERQRESTPTVVQEVWKTTQYHNENGGCHLGSPLLCLCHYPQTAVRAPHSSVSLGQPAATPNHEAFTPSSSGVFRGLAFLCSPVPGVSPYPTGAS